MKLAIHPPSNFEAEVDVAKDGGFTVTPESFVGQPISTCAYIVEYDDKDTIVARHRLVIDSGKGDKVRLLSSRSADTAASEAATPPITEVPEK